MGTKLSALGTKRRIQIDEFFAREFLDTLTKAGSQLPRDILDLISYFSVV
jgi:hypothetical protein